MSKKVKAALKVCGLSKEKWDLFLKIAADNRAMKDHGWAYVGGMRDVLWVLADGPKDRKAYDTLDYVLRKVKATTKVKHE